MPREFDRIYLTPIYSSTHETLHQPDMEGRDWGFSEYAELMIEDLDMADTLDKVVKETLIVHWCVLRPYPHYRVTRSRYLDLLRKGVRRISEEEAGKVRQHFLSGKGFE